MTINYRSIEISAVIVTVVGKLIYDHCKESRAILAVAIIGFWVVYLFIRVKNDKGILNDWGFTKTNFKPAMQCVALVGFVSVYWIIAPSLVFHKTKFNINIFYVIPLYIIWGLIQQFIVISLFAGNLNDFQKPKIKKWLIVAITSFLFSTLHTSNETLMIVTFFMAIICTSIFLKYRNLYPLGIFHGVVGAVFYYFTLHEDQWSDLIAAICNRICI
jgi:hypothetical protein